MDPNLDLDLECNPVFEGVEVEGEFQEVSIEEILKAPSTSNTDVSTVVNNAKATEQSKTNSIKVANDTNDNVPAAESSYKAVKDTDDATSVLINRKMPKHKTPAVFFCILCTQTFPHPIEDITEFESVIKYLAEFNISEHKLPKKGCMDCIKLLDLSYKFKRQLGHSLSFILEEKSINPCYIKKKLPTAEICNPFIDPPKDDENALNADFSSKCVRYECLACPSDFYSLNELKEHNLEKHEKSKCKECGYHSVDHDDLEAHKKVHAVHKSQEKVCCEKCGEICTTTKFKTHILEHEISKLLECTVCKCTIPDSLMKMHMKVHGKKYPCKQCDRQFGTAAALNHHRYRVHVPKFKCKECKLTFADPRMYTRHMRTHTGEKPFVCEFCERAFSCKYNLRTHMRIHTNTFPYKCNYCEQSFRHNVTRKEHQRKKHPKEVKKDEEKLINEKMNE